MDYQLVIHNHFVSKEEEYSCNKFQIITSAATWLLNFQSQEGYFVENAAHENKFSDGAFKKEKNNIVLTAHVLIALEETADIVQVNC